MISVSDLLLVNHHGEVVEGNDIVNRAAFAIHSQIHAARPDVISAAHCHSMHGKAWSSLGRTLDPITQDACAFYDDHVVFDDYTGVVLDTEEGKRIAHALGGAKAAILQQPRAAHRRRDRRRGGVVVHHDGSARARRSCSPRPRASRSLIDEEDARLTYTQVGPTSPAGSRSSPCTR